MPRLLKFRLPMFEYVDAPRRVSVIVPTKNRSPQLRQALASIRSIEGPDLEFELIVVDNGSTDNSKDVAREFGALVLQTLAPGAAAARNEGLRVASTDYIALLDDDDVWLPGHIRPHLSLLDAEPEFAAVVGQMVLADYELRDRGEPYPTHLPDDGDLFAAFLDLIPQVGAGLVRASVLETVGYFDPGWKSDEDWDWYLRLALHHKIGFVPVPSVLFRQRPLGATAEQEWQRLSYMRGVFLSNLVRAGSRVPGALTTTRMFLRHNGHFYAYFAALAQQQFAAHHKRAALLALQRAILSSPPHALFHLARGLSSRPLRTGTL